MRLHPLKGTLTGKFMDYQVAQNNLFAQFIDTLSGGISIDIVTVMTAGVSIFCIIIAINLLGDALRDEQQDKIYDRYNSKYGDKKLSRSEGRAENKRQLASQRRWLENNKPSDSHGGYF